MNILSLDPITKEDAEKEANTIPEYIANPLCQEAIDLMKTFERPKDEADLLKQTGMISRIALREGISPSVLYLFIISGSGKL